jgi:hypothetical protein
MNVLCFFCERYLEQPGALLFGIPKVDGTVNKYHVCVDCWPCVLIGTLTALEKRKEKHADRRDKVRTKRRR